MYDDKFTLTENHFNLRISLDGTFYGLNYYHWEGKQRKGNFTNFIGARSCGFPLCEMFHSSSLYLKTQQKRYPMWFKN